VSAGAARRWIEKMLEWNRGVLRQGASTAPGLLKVPCNITDLSKQ